MGGEGVARWQKAGKIWKNYTTLHNILQSKQARQEPTKTREGTGTESKETGSEKFGHPCPSPLNYRSCMFGGGRGGEI